MQGAYLELPVTLCCMGCDEEIAAKWRVPLEELSKGKLPKGPGAWKALEDSAADAGWLSRGTAALCPACLADAVAGDFEPPRARTMGQVADQIAALRAVKKLRRRADDDPVQ